MYIFLFLLVVGLDKDPKHSNEALPVTLASETEANITYMTLSICSASRMMENCF